ncbi:MAG TPA: hypothetical protein VL383_12870 [Gemmatimonadaceae bacterium]|jgi:hypothetical protein|nr:hypothetical protein [Gemmatimonadaceae bacterium]
MPRTERSRRAHAISAIAILMATALASPLRAQGGVLLQGIVDGEAWSTSATSNLLTRAGGHPAGLGRLTAWGAWEPFRAFVLYAEGELETGGATTAPETEVYSHQFGIRYSPSRLAVIDVGRVTPVIGTFASRRYSTRNPLIGVPDGYSLDYPLAIKLSGETAHFDYRAALVSLPTTHAAYQPDPTDRLRPAVGLGVTPFVGFRLGGSFTMGPYLNRDISPTLLAGQKWTDFDQRVIAFDLAFARGYLETHAEAARGTYEVPGRANITGFTYYGEAKYTFTPRFFIAGRAERNNYPAIRPTATGYASRTWDFVDGELGAGFRARASTLLKASVRGDRWWGLRPNQPGFRGQGGYAIVAQLSQAFDVTEWVKR